MTGRHRARRRDLPRATIVVVAVAAAAVTVPAIGTRVPHTLIVAAPADVPWTLPATAGPTRVHAPTHRADPPAPHTTTPVGWAPRLYDAWQAGPGRSTPSAGVERPVTVAAATDSPAPTTPAVTVPAAAPTSAAPSTAPTPTPDPAATTPAEPTSAAPTPDPTSPAPTTEPPPTTGPAPTPTPTAEPTTDPGCGHGKPRKCQP